VEIHRAEGLFQALALLQRNIETGAQIGKAVFKIKLDGEKKPRTITIKAHRPCEDKALAASDVLVHELDLTSFLTSVVQVLGLRWQRPALRFPGVWAIGVSARVNTPRQPAFLQVQARRAAFLEGLRQFLVEIDGPFLLVAPNCIPNMWSESASSEVSEWETGLRRNIQRFGEGFARSRKRRGDHIDIQVSALGRLGLLNKGYAKTGVQRL